MSWLASETVKGRCCDFHRSDAVCNTTAALPKKAGNPLNNWAAVRLFGQRAKWHTWVAVSGLICISVVIGTRYKTESRAFKYQELTTPSVTGRFWKGGVDVSKGEIHAISKLMLISDCLPNIGWDFSLKHAPECGSGNSHGSTGCIGRSRWFDLIDELPSIVGMFRTVSIPITRSLYRCDAGGSPASIFKNPSVPNGGMLRHYREHLVLLGKTFRGYANPRPIGLSDVCEGVFGGICTSLGGVSGFSYGDSLRSDFIIGFGHRRPLSISETSVYSRSNKSESSRCGQSALYPEIEVLVGALFTLFVFLYIPFCNKDSICNVIFFALALSFLLPFALFTVACGTYQLMQIISHCPELHDAVAYLGNVCMNGVKQFSR